MIKDFFSSFKDNIVQKTTNPFLGTFIVVWIIRNWKFVYTLFNFDKDYTLEKKIFTIENYFSNYSVWRNLGTCILISIFVLLITYTLLALSRLIVNFYDKMVNPVVYKITDKSSIVLKSEYTKVRQELIRLEARLEEERETKIRLQNDYEALEKRIAEKVSKQDVITEKEEVSSEDSEELSPKVTLLINKLKKDGSANEFDTIAGNILNGITMEKRFSKIQEFTNIGLIAPDRYSVNDKWYYKFTPDGRKVYDFLLLEKLK